MYINLTSGNKDERAKARGITDPYDVALPQPWVDDVKKKTGFDDVPWHFVWAYPEKSVFGMPKSLDEKGDEILEKYLHS